jgi:hypothetical protein
VVNRDIHELIAQTRKDNKLAFCVGRKAIGKLIVQRSRVFLTP